MKRSGVYLLIDEERNYQDKVEWDHQGKPTVEAEILMIEEYVAKARQAWVTSDGDKPSLHELRKVAAMAIRCLENHGDLTISRGN